MIDTLFREEGSLLHGYDCRLKLLLLPLLVVYFFLPQSLTVSGGFTLFLLVLTLSVLGGKDLLTPLNMIFPLLILILILTPLFHKTGTVLLSVGNMTLVTSHGLMEALHYIFRLTGISTLFFLFFRTTPMEDILLGLSWFRLPYVVTLVISIALRYIPHLAGLYGQIKAAHALRCGVNDTLAPGKGWTRLKGLFPILVSLMIQSVKTIPLLTMALELKGIGRDNPRTRLRELPLVPSVRLQILSSLLLFVFLVLLLIVFR
ncbi:energy-coupling factor transporter transmembrane protein EcfT [Oceanispirochaeta sp.]|jgi:energy-coupling factor transport system permease protein|uniref:energy-coupling factor transporter transmembrane component T family protein n=1 Tax=Oceanispirochaeta sp. TaxID=2035350 RepID=UPI0026289238|nr:energy-coupling factor transporter transmembrane component T [Oceanispirochaeta sp.]MDA3957115.1 energy-coupling factor transporter transmembrane component T [Oceanispirochaeta sp.]